MKQLSGKKILILAAILIIVLLAAVLIIPKFKKEEHKALNVWMPPFGTGDTLDKEFWEKTFEKFEAENDCDVTIEIVPWSNYEEKYLTAYAGNTGPDVGYMSMEMVSSFIEMGSICKMDEYVTDADRENYLYLDKGYFNGGQYMFPFIVGNPRVLMCNMDILNAAGVTEVPKTWDEFVAAALKVKEKIMEFIHLCSLGETPATWSRCSILSSIRRVDVLSTRIKPN